MPTGTLYLIPAPLGDSSLETILPQGVREITARLDTFIVEHPKTARAYLKQIPTAKPLQELQMLTLDEHTPENALQEMLTPLLQGKDVGLLSEAGCPAVADPGANLVRLAQQQGIRVVPLVGPSSILLALMASGLSGQRFSFHGYLPVDKAERKSRLQSLEQASSKNDETQIFIETPYRNRQMLEAIMESCGSDTLLCVATDVSLDTEMIVTKRVGEWKKKLPEIEKRPTVFLLLSASIKKTKRH